MEPTDPFDKHPGLPGAMEHRADTLLRLAEEATDQEAVTTRAHDPAVASWHGMGAAELQAAPDDVRRKGQDVASRVAWAALPLLTWADHVRRFNSRVDDLLDQYAGVPAAVERELAAEFGEQALAHPNSVVDEARLYKRMTKIRELRSEWQEAFRIHLDEGKQDVASMLKHGPSWAALAAARDRGLLPASPLGQFFVAGWDQAAALGEAERIGGLILAGQGDHLSVEELERLGDILEQYGENDEFSYLLMTGLGQEDLLQLNAGVALLAGEDSDPRLQAAVGAIQAGLATALATATTRRGTGGSGDFDPYQPAEFELDTDWMLGLAAAGRELLEISHPNYASFVYGYQALGVLLSNGGFDDGFLTIIGSDLIDFEMAQGGSDIWTDLALNHNDGARLNWLHGPGIDQPAGFDPMIGLMEALAESPEGMRGVLTSRSRVEEVVLYPGDDRSPTAEVHRLPRLQYLLTERHWPHDVVGSPDLAPEHTGPRPGLVALGQALEAATRVDPDDAAYRIVEAIIFETAVQQRVEVLPSGIPNDSWADTFSEVNLIHPELRQPFANITNDYIQDLHWVLAGLQGSPSEDIPYEEQLNLKNLDARHLGLFLADLGKDSEAAGTVAVAHYRYAAELLEHYFEDWDLSGDADAVKFDVLGPLTSTLAAIDVGATTQMRADLGAGDDTYNEALRNRFFWAETAVAGLSTAAPGAGTVGHGTETVLEQWEKSLQQDSTGAANLKHGDIKHVSRQILENMVSAAAYHHVTGEMEPAEFFSRFNPDDVEGAQILIYPDDHPRAGDFVPVSEWDQDHWNAWGQFRTATGNRGIGNLMHDAKSGYDLGFLGTQDDLQNRDS